MMTLFRVTDPKFDKLNDSSLGLPTTTNLAESLEAPREINYIRLTGCVIEWKPQFFIAIKLRIRRSSFNIL